MGNRLPSIPSVKINVSGPISSIMNFNPRKNPVAKVPEILFITSYPPRECGIATYSQDLLSALKNKYKDSFKIKICAIENEYERHKYPKEVKYILNTKHCKAFDSMANVVNLDQKIEQVVVQHEFGFFAQCPEEFLSFLEQIKKTKITVFHTVLPNVDEKFKANVKAIAKLSDHLLVMTKNSAAILATEYSIAPEKISVISHGTHLVPHSDKESLKRKYDLGSGKVLSTFGLLSSGKSIETTLEAMPDIIRTQPDIQFLIIGKTHPGVVKHEGEKYREFLEAKVDELNLRNNVIFVNKYLPLEELLEYLQLTDIYLFTSKDPNQAVSGTFSYAASCGCAIVSTPIPHAVEFLSGDAGIIIDFCQPKQLAEAVNKLLYDVKLRKQLKMNALHKIVPTAWENVAVAHAEVFSKLSENKIRTLFKNPLINISHLKRMTTHFGIIQFSKLNHPDIESGYTLDDNARALIAMCEYFELTADEQAIPYIRIYLDFIAYCQQADGTFFNYVNYNRIFTEQNQLCNLEDSNGRAIWALGYLISDGKMLPETIRVQAETILERTLVNIENVHSPRAMAFTIKGLYYYNVVNYSKAVRLLIKKLADRLTQMYLKESSTEWQWFESYLTYANSTLPEALVFAFKETGEEMYREVAQNSFEFLLSQTFDKDNNIKVISNNNWYTKGGERLPFGEQPIDVAYTVLALNTFYSLTGNEAYVIKMKSAFDWFLGRNHLNQIIYNPCTGGCFDGLEQTTVNLNQGAESTISYLLARFCMKKYKISKKIKEAQLTKKQKKKRAGLAFLK